MTTIKTRNTMKITTNGNDDDVDENVDDDSNIFKSLSIGMAG